MSVPEIMNFHAYHNTQPPGPGSLYVVGEVETDNGALRPILRKTEPQGISPTILLLTLTIEKTGDTGTKDIAFRDARYDHEGSYDGVYETVEILFEGSSIKTLTPQTIS